MASIGGCSIFGIAANSSAEGNFLGLSSVGVYQQPKVSATCDRMTAAVHGFN